MYVLSVTAVAFSGYLTYLEVFVLRALCPYCLGAAGLAVVLLGAAVIRRPASARRRPVRLGAIGVATAVVTIVVGAGIHAGTPDPERVAYQEALARHLAATGAIMYGAYWAPLSDLGRRKSPPRGPPYAREAFQALVLQGGELPVALSASGTRVRRRTSRRRSGVRG